MKSIPLKETQKKNLEAESVALKNEIDNKSKELTSVFDKIAACNQAFQELELEKSRIAAYRIATEEALNRSRKEAYKELEENSQLSLRLKADIKGFNEEVRVTTKLLARLNAQCITANNELMAAQAEIERLDPLVQQVQKLKSEIIVLQQEHEFYSSKRNEVQVDIINRLRDSDERLAKNNRELERIKALGDEKIQAMNDAEYKLKEFTDHLYTNMNDYAIVRERLNVRWKEVYPELKLPLE